MAGYALHLALPFVLVACSAAVFMKVPGVINNTHELQTPWRQTMANYEDLQYYGSIKVGGQKLHGVFDTGSIELVVISDKCNYWCGEAAALYHSKESQSFKHGSFSISISYGSGDLRGEEAYDTVSIGPYSATDTPFWEISDATMPVLLSSDFEAIIGLGPIAPQVELMEPGKPKNNNSFAVALKKLALRRYSVCLMKDPGMPGYLTWNDDIHLKEPNLFTELAITEANYWMVKLENVQLGEGGITLCQNGCGAIIDSGTSLLAMPDNAFKMMTKFIRNLGTHCSNMMALPELHFSLNGMRYTLPPDSYVGQVHGAVPNGLVSHFEKTSSKCQATLMKIHMSSVLGETWILGMPFFRSYYTVFHQDQGEKPKLFTSKSTDECQPMKADLKLAVTNRQVARHIDLSKLRLPDWAKEKKSAAKKEVVRQVLLETPPLQHGRHPHIAED